LTGFDPTAATNAYLAALPPAGHLKAIHYTQGGHWVLLWGWLVTVVAAFLILRSGLLHRLRKRIDGARRRPLAASAVVALVFLLLDWLLTLPWSAYADWWRQKQYGLSNQGFPAWLGEAALAGVISAIGLGLFLVVLYALIRRAPRTWWAWATGVAVVFIVFGLLIAPIAIEPLFNTFTPAPPGPVRDQVVALAKKAHVPSDKIYIYNGSKQSNRYTANVAGLFGSARVAMSDVMFQKGADLAEVRGVVGHEMGHYARGHVIWGALWVAIEALLAFGLMQLLFPWFDNTVTRLQEADADHFSLVVANEPDGLSKALVKTIEYRADSPSAIEEFLFYDHPSVRRRVQTAMDWKAAHMTATGEGTTP